MADRAGKVAGAVADCTAGMVGTADTAADCTAVAVAAVAGAEAVVHTDSSAAAHR